MNKPIPIQLRFSDVDSMGHVNNAFYLNYFETARLHFFNDLLGKNWDWNKKGVILLRNEVDYLKPLLLKDEPLAHVGVEKLGTKSITLTYKIEVGFEPYCKGRSVLVCYDYTKRMSIEVPKEMRSALENIIEEQDL